VEPLVLRDMMFGDRRHFRELLTRSEEGIASNILADRLKKLSAGHDHPRRRPDHKQKAIYSLTEQAIELVPILALIGGWGTRHLPVSEELSIRAKLLEAAASPCGRPSWGAAPPPSGQARRGPVGAGGAAGRLQRSWRDAALAGPRILRGRTERVVDVPAQLVGS
jgi:DNA-binding HxlR family transcriptional regulator